MEKTLLHTEVEVEEVRDLITIPMVPLEVKEETGAMEDKDTFL
jgi:hypothetical protein